VILEAADLPDKVQQVGDAPVGDDLVVHHAHHAHEAHLAAGGRLAEQFAATCLVVGLVRRHHVPADLHAERPGDSSATVDLRQNRGRPEAVCSKSVV
jgi:hypothetical protein